MGSQKPGRIHRAVGLRLIFPKPKEVTTAQGRWARGRDSGSNSPLSGVSVISIFFLPNLKIGGCTLVCRFWELLGETNIPPHQVPSQQTCLFLCSQSLSPVELQLILLSLVFMNDDHGPFSFSVVNIFNRLFQASAIWQVLRCVSLSKSLKLAVPGTFSCGNNGPGFRSPRFFWGSMEIMGVKTPYKP